MSEAHQSDADLTTSLPDSWRAELARHDSPDERIGVIEDSLRCFAFGWLTLLPVVGVAWLYPAVRRFAAARRRKVEWNPARGYLAAGLALASCGWLMALVSWLLMLNALPIASEFGASDGDLLSLLFVALLVTSPAPVVGLGLALVTRFPWLKTELTSERFLKRLKRVGLLVVIALCGSFIWTQLNWPDLSTSTAAPYRPVIALCFWLLGALGFLPFWKQTRDTPGAFVLLATVWLAGLVLMVQRVFTGE